MVTISKRKGAVLCKQYFGVIRGRKFARIIRREFVGAFTTSCKPDGKVFFRTVAQDRMVHVFDGPWNLQVQQFPEFPLGILT